MRTKLNENYHRYIATMHILQRFVCNGFEKCDKKKVCVSSKNVEMINYFISILMAIINDYDDNMYKHPEYIRCIMEEWGDSVTNVTFNSYLNNEIVPGVNVYDKTKYIDHDTAYCPLETALYTKYKGLDKRKNISFPSTSNNSNKKLLQTPSNFMFSLNIFL